MSISALNRRRFEESIPRVVCVFQIILRDEQVSPSYGLVCRAVNHIGPLQRGVAFRLDFLRLHLTIRFDLDHSATAIDPQRGCRGCSFWRHLAGGLAGRRFPVATKPRARPRRPKFFQEILWGYIFYTKFETIRLENQQGILFPPLSFCECISSVTISSGNSLSLLAAF